MLHYYRATAKLLACCDKVVTTLRQHRFRSVVIFGVNLILKKQAVIS